MWLLNKLQSYGDKPIHKHAFDVMIYGSYILYAIALPFYRKFNLVACTTGPVDCKIKTIIGLTDIISIFGSILTTCKNDHLEFNDETRSHLRNLLVAGILSLKFIEDNLNDKKNTRRNI